MRVGRLVLVVATMVAILVFPLLFRDAIQAFQLPSAYAAGNFADAGGRVYQNGNNNDNGDDNDNDGGSNDDDDDDDDDNDNNNDDDDGNDNDDEDNDNVACYTNLNDNDEVPCDFDDNGNYNDNFYTPTPSYTPPAPGPAASAAATRRCFAPGEAGDVTLMLNGGSVAIRVVSPGLPQSVWIELDDVDPASIPTPPGGATLLGSMVWRMDSGSGCEAGAASQVLGDVNLGIPYNISADKSKLQIVRLQNGQWVEVNTVPDPSPTNPYISSTIRDTGTYAVIQKP